LNLLILELMKPGFAAIGLLLMAPLAVFLYGCGVDSNNPGVAPPQNVVATAGNEEVSVSWDSVNDASSYIVYWNITGKVTKSDHSVATSDRAIVVKGRTNGVEYYFAVASVSLSGAVGDLSKEVKATPLPLAPPPPAGLTALAAVGEITLTWSASPGATNYTIYFNTTGAVKDSDSSVKAGGVLTYTHKNLKPGSTYYYRLTASNVGGESALSNEVYATAPLAPPPATSALAATAGPGKVSLAWSAVDRAFGYVIHFNTTGLVTKLDTAINISGPILTYDHTGLTPAQTYYYAIAAITETGEGALSNEVSATPQ
jgi:cellulose 1,4-beta-cellobiosidase